MDAVSDPDTEEVVGMLSAQSGKTEIVNNIVGFHVDQDPAPMLVLQPTLEMGDAWSKDRLAPMLRDTPALRGRVKDPRARDSGNTVRHKVFPGGHLTIAGANSAASLAMRPIRVLICDEVDRYPRSAGTQGDPLALAARRTANFWNRKKLYFSTPTDSLSRINQLYIESDQRRYSVPCEHCGAFQFLEWKRVIWPFNEPWNAAYHCEHCGTAWSEGDRLKAVRRGQWVATRKTNNKRAGFHLNALYSPWANLGALAVEFLEAKAAGPEKLQPWINTVLAEIFEDEAEQIDAEILMERREPVAGDMPPWACIVTGAVDVQDDRLEYTATAWGRDEQMIPVDREVLDGDPGGRDVWDDLEQVLNRTYRHPHGPQLRAHTITVDTGGHFTTEAYAFCQRNRRRRVVAIKGMPGAGRPIVSAPTRKTQGRDKIKIALYTVGTHEAKRIIFNRLRLQNPGPRYLHFPKTEWCDEEFFHQLTAEKLETSYHRGVKIQRWVPTRPRNEILDLYVYNLAALHLIGKNWRRVLRDAADRLEQVAGVETYQPPAVEPEPEEAPEPESEPIVRPRRRKGRRYALNGRG